jgi:hypothetical protein
MTWLLESPWPAITLGLFLEVGLAIALVRSGRGVILVAMAFVLVLTAGMLVLEWAVVTEIEQVENALARVAATLEANDPPAVLRLMSPKSPRRGEVESILSRVVILEAHVGGDLEVRTNRLTNPPSATAYFTGRFRARDRRGEIPYEQVVLKFKITLHHRGQSWLIYDYAVAEPDGGRWTSGRLRER